MTNAGAPETFYRMFDSAAGDRTCVVLPDSSEIRFGAMAARSRSIAAGLARLGLCRGDAVGVWMANTPAWLQVFLACARLGALAVGINARFRGREIGELLRRSSARLLVADAWQGKVSGDEIFRTITPSDLAALRAVVVAGESDPSAWRPFEVLNLDDILDEASAADAGRPEDACIVFTTSGTTGQPKLVVHRQRGIVAHARDVADAFELARPGSAVLQIVPFCGAFGFSQAIAAIAAACPLVVPPAFDAAEAARLAHAHRVSNIVGTNDMLDRMLAAATDEKPFPNLRFFGHANFNPALSDLPARAEARGAKLRGLFGMSETLALFAVQPATAGRERRQLSGGIPVSPSGQARVRDLASGEIAAAGVSGEIELRGPSLMSGYLGDDDATRTAFTPDGFLRTGDLGYATGDGGFVHLGRMGDVLRLGGFLVNPLEIEETVLEIESLSACQVVEAQRDGRTRPVAFVVPAAGARTDEPTVIAHCRERLASFKVPARVIIIDSLPTVEGPNGVKVSRDELRRIAQRCDTR
ncbi:MAG TPA: AMP-binding protein [Candidatus Binatia bacterium]|jgi:fatty-acyl-CoA synthase